MSCSVIVLETWLHNERWKCIIRVIFVYKLVMIKVYLT